MPLPVLWEMSVPFCFSFHRWCFAWHAAAAAARMLFLKLFFLQTEKQQTCFFTIFIQVQQTAWICHKRRKVWFFSGILLFFSFAFFLRERETGRWERHIIVFSFSFSKFSFLFTMSRACHAHCPQTPISCLLPRSFSQKVMSGCLFPLFTVAHWEYIFCLQSFLLTATEGHLRIGEKESPARPAMATTRCRHATAMPDGEGLACAGEITFSINNSFLFLKPVTQIITTPSLSERCAARLFTPFSFCSYHQQACRQHGKFSSFLLPLSFLPAPLSSLNVTSFS